MTGIRERALIYSKKWWSFLWLKIALSGQNTPSIELKIDQHNETARVCVCVCVWEREREWEAIGCFPTCSENGHINYMLIMSFFLKTHKHATLQKKKTMAGCKLLAFSFCTYSTWSVCLPLCLSACMRVCVFLPELRWRSAPVRWTQISVCDWITASEINRWDLHTQTRPNEAEHQLIVRLTIKKEEEKIKIKGGGWARKKEKGQIKRRIYPSDPPLSLSFCPLLSASPHVPGVWL